MTSEPNPFVYSRPLAAGDVVDREQETERLLALGAGGHYVRLYAPRRYDKTSLLTKALQEAELREHMVTVLVDCYGVLSLTDVTIRIERAYAAQLKGKLRERVDRLLAGTGLGLSLGAYGISVKLQLERKTDPLPALHALLDLPLRLGSGRRALMAFDEFQDVANVPQLDALLRGHLQHHGDSAAYIFAGSEPGLMRQLFETKAKPLYGQAEPLRLGRLPAADLADYIGDRFAATDRNVGDVLTALLDMARGHPQRAMLLAHRLWELVPAGTSATSDHWRAALAHTKVDTAPEFDALWRSLTLVEQKTIRAIEETDGTLYRPRVLQQLRLAKASAHKAAANLVARAEIERVDGRYRLVDPLFARWVREMKGSVA